MEHSRFYYYVSAILFISGLFFPDMVGSIGINYGQIANNLPTPDNVIPLVKSIGATKVKLYDADPRVLKAFANTGVEFIVGLGNEYLSKMRDPDKAQVWVKANVQAYLPATKITCITIGNEILSFNDSSLTDNLLPAMQGIHTALVNLGLDKQVSVTTAHSLSVLEVSYPPSAGSFRKDLVGCITPILNFHAKTNSPFLINAYPFFAFKSNPKQVSLDFVLFQPNQGKLAGHLKGDEDEVGATFENAKKYNGNLLKTICQRKGTPMRPNTDLNIYVFALFNENMKPGPTSERNYGLFKPDGSPAYSLGINGTGLISTNSTATTTTTTTITTPAPQSQQSSSTGYLSISVAVKVMFLTS
ncbi:hypothetical protein OIU84_024121 [Salix udensis]|uniref:glucan endo-1,3-beta-D-glucosidase n=1 Tax=Salix udensis TaxID=889485 RepID=A0AAD6KGJ6_9ROSI|nr:hypothetical protein OIU84_024121 [Salix udensis]